MELEEAARVYAEASAQYAKEFPGYSSHPDNERWRELWKVKCDAEVALKKCVDDMRRWRELRVEELASAAKAECEKPPIRTDAARKAYHLMLFNVIREYITTFATVDRALPHHPHEKVVVKIEIRKATRGEVERARKDCGLMPDRDTDSVVILEHWIKGDEHNGMQDFVEIANHDDPVAADPGGAIAQSLDH